MSADAWRVCPKCKQIHEKELEKAEKRLNDSYGKVSLEQWKLMSDSFDLLQVKEIDPTLREDFQVHTTEDGLFYLDYRCSCSTCGFSHKEKIEKPIL